MKKINYFTNIYLILLAMFFTGIVFAQKQTLTGVVTEVSGEPIPGASVFVKDSNIGIQTDFDGKYVLQEVPLDAVLVVSYVGFNTQEITIDGRKEINVILQLGTHLEEVVITGYGTQKKSDITGSVGSVKSEELLLAPQVNVLQGLQGKVPGVAVFARSGVPGGDPLVMIRGAGSINAGTGPLVVIDGVAMGGLGDINPSDIVSMEVLKDASSTAIYGARGANGVILVTTKRGGKTEGTVINYDTYTSLGVLPKELDVLDSKQWVEVIKRGLQTSSEVYGKDISEFNGLEINPRFFNEDGTPKYNTNWQRELTRQAFSTDHTLSVQSRLGQTSVGAVFNYGRHEGIMLASNFVRKNAKLIYDTKATDWLTVNANLSYNRTEREGVIGGGGGGMDAPRMMIEAPPVLPVKWSDGKYAQGIELKGFGLEEFPNPVKNLLEAKNHSQKTMVFGNLALIFHILPGLDLKTQLGVSTSSLTEQNFTPKDLFGKINKGDASQDLEEVMYWQQESFLTYNKVIAQKHSVNAVLGVSWQENVSKGFGGSTKNFIDNSMSYFNLGAGSEPDKPSSYYSRWALNSYFTRVGYAFDKKYMLTATARYDGSSRLGKNTKYGFFPSVGVGWMLTNEEFFQSLGIDDVVNRFKLRASYGFTGNTEIDPYSALAKVKYGTKLIGGSRQTSAELNSISNPNLKWETAKQTDIGFEMGLFNNRISMEVDLYEKITSDLLLGRPLPESTGFGEIIDNIGSISNRGVEFTLNTVNVRSGGGDFLWNTSFNVSYNENKVLKLGDNNEDMFLYGWVSGANVVLRVGEPVNSFYGVRRLGTWGTDEVEEANKVGAKPGEAKRTTNKEILGKGVPDYMGSFINTFQYKGFDATIDFEFVYGVDYLQRMLHTVEDRTGQTSSLASVIKEAWTPENQNTMVQRIRHAPSSGQNTALDSRWVADGSFLRLRTVSLGYTLPKEVLSKAKVFKKIRVYASVQNAWLLSSDTFFGYDPQSSSSRGKFDMNSAFFEYPKPRTFSLGLSVSF